MFPAIKHPSEGTVCRAIFLLCLLLNLGFSSVGWRNSPLEIHEFRQVQTALTARAIQEDGWSLAYPMPVFGPPWSAPMEFPFYQVCVARVATLTGLAIEPAGRLVALAFLYLALPACFGLAGLVGLSPARRWLALGLILVSPIYLYYSRTIMIESTALCACAWFLLAYVRTLERDTGGWLAAAMVFGVLASLAKITTFIVFLAVAFVYTLWLLQHGWRAGGGRWPRVRPILWRGLAATVPAVIAGTAWVRFADIVKLSNPLSAFLASGPMSAFNFGTWHQRLSPEFWTRMGASTTTSVLTGFNLALITLFGLIGGREAQGRVTLLIAGFVAGPLIFSNLYFVHDYYFYASAVFLLGALAVAWNRVLDSPWFSRGAKWTIIGLSLGLQVLDYTQAYLFIQNRPLAPPAELPAILAAVTQPDDVVLVYGRDWESKIAWFAHRRTIMITDAMAQDITALNRVLDQLGSSHVTALVVTGEMRRYPDFFIPLLKRLQLHPLATLMSQDTLVYLAERQLMSAVSLLEPMPLQVFRFVAPGDDSTIPRGRYLVERLPDRRVVDMMSPAPAVILHPFGLTRNEVGGKSVFNAHVPTDVIFDLPKGAGGAYAEFGVLPAAYAGKNSTEGMEFRVEWVSPEGKHRILCSTYLSPSQLPSDRGQKQLRVQLPHGATGQLWFRTLPGPTGSIAFAWGYWARIELR